MKLPEGTLNGNLPSSPEVDREAVSKNPIGFLEASIDVIDTSDLGSLSVEQVGILMASMTKLLEQESPKILKLAAEKISDLIRENFGKETIVGEFKGRSQFSPPHVPIHFRSDLKKNEVNSIRNHIKDIFPTISFYPRTVGVAFSEEADHDWQASLNFNFTQIQ